MKRAAVWLPAVFRLVCRLRPSDRKICSRTSVTDFSTLYEDNCAGCHGRDGRFGAARPLNDPLYLALIGKENAGCDRERCSATAMPAFEKKAVAH